MQRRRNKVKDKPPPDPRREYLDAESSDEAERLGKIYEKNIKRTHFSVSTFSIFRSFPDFASSLRLSYFRHFRARRFQPLSRTTSSRTPIPPLNPKIPQNRLRNKQHTFVKGILNTFVFHNSQLDLFVTRFFISTSIFSKYLNFQFPQIATCLFHYRSVRDICDWYMQLIHFWILHYTARRWLIKQDWLI